MFEKTLTDVVKGIRASRRDTSLYISQCIAEIKAEINSSDMFVKANALQKLTFLQMMGYGMSWASFASIELMSSSRFAHKRIAYLAASQGFTQDTDVILLTTNLLKKELRGGVYEAGLAVNCISNIVTEDLARDLLPELTLLTNHPQPYLRKKAILCLFKVFVKYPQGLRLTFDKIQECLEDQNPSVVSCAVNVITELSDKNPKNYLHLAPAFFQLLTTSSNNWMLIKVVKLLGSLVPEEPRLARKLLEPLADIVRNTKAKSLLFESVHTITLCLPYCRRSDGTMPAIVPELVTLCAETLQSFVNESDQNLKYLGLVGFASLMQSHPKVLSAPGYRPIILACLSDQDVTIRTRALSLLPGMASKKNLMELVSQLLKHVELASGSYKLDLVSTIIEMCSGEKYALLGDFAWYLNILFQLGHMRGLEAHSNLLRSQISDVALRVLPVRVFAVMRSIEVLLEGESLPSSQSSDSFGVDISLEPYGGDNGRGRHIMPELLPALAWIVGEYSDLIRKALSLTENNNGEEQLLNETSKGTYHSLIQIFTSTSNYQKLPTSTHKIYLQAAMKVFAASTADERVSDKELEASCDTIHQNLPLYMQSVDVAVQERAFSGHALLLSMNLIGGQSSIPVANSSLESGSNGEVEGDLLGMGGSMPVSNPQKQTPTSLLSPHTGVASKCRQQAPVLNYILKPSPMKPISAKAQRKKSQNPIGIDASEIAAVDLSVFSAMIEDELKSMSGLKVSMEAVSFTQQKPVRVADPVPVPAMNSSTQMQGFGNSGISGGANMSGFQRSGAPNAFDNSGAGLRQNQGDPFYLDSAPKTKSPEGQDPGQFGMIQLSDSDEDAETPARRKKKKKKKEKRSDASSALNSFNGNATSMSIGGAGVAVYDSEDEDDLGLHSFSARPKNGKRSGTDKGFEGLAQVDLTEPLREDEVMPERKHRVVPERAEPTPAKEKKRSKKDKKNKPKKSSKKENKKQSTASAAEPFSNIGDLLELDGFGGMSLNPAPALAPVPALGNASNNTITDAFEDLLGLQSPSPQAPASLAYSFPAPNDLGAPSPTESVWIKASVKNSKSGSVPDIDVSAVTVHFKIYPASQGSGQGVMLLVRVLNASTTLLQHTTVHVSEGKSIVLGDVAPNSSVISEKVGPFVYQGIDAGFDLRGSMSFSGALVSVKFQLPVSFHLTPWHGLTLEGVSNELSAGNMDSRSAKFSFSPRTQQASIMSILKGHLHAVEVDAVGVGASATTGTLAAQSRGGVKLLMLVKVKDGVIKIDLKSSHPGFGKQLASELKSLCLE